MGILHAITRRTGEMMRDPRFTAMHSSQKERQPSKLRWRNLVSWFFFGKYLYWNVLIVCENSAVLIFRHLSTQNEDYWEPVKDISSEKNQTIHFSQANGSKISLPGGGGPGTENSKENSQDFCPSVYNLHITLASWWAFRVRLVTPAGINLYQPVYCLVGIIAYDGTKASALARTV